MRVNENWWVGLELCGNIEVESYIGRIGSKVRDLNERVGCSKNSI